MENRLFTLKTLFLPSGEGKSVFRKKCFFDPDHAPPPQGGFLKSRIFSENRLFTLKTLFSASGEGKPVFRKKCFFDPDANGHTHTHTHIHTNYFFSYDPPYSRGNISNSLSLFCLDNDSPRVETSTVFSIFE